MSVQSTSLTRAVRHRAARLQWGKLLIHATLIAGAFVMVIPFLWTVSYPHLTLPTIYSVSLSAVAVSLKTTPSSSVTPRV